VAFTHTWGHATVGATRHSGDHEANGRNPGTGRLPGASPIAHRRGKCW